MEWGPDIVMAGMDNGEEVTNALQAILTSQQATITSQQATLASQQATIASQQATITSQAATIASLMSDARTHSHFPDLQVVEGAVVEVVDEEETEPGVQEVVEEEVVEEEVVEDGMGEAVAHVGEEARVEDQVSFICKESTAHTPF